MSRKDNLKKYGNLLHNAATKSSSKETVKDAIVVEEVVEATELPTTPSLPSFEGVFPDTLDEQEENKDNLFKGVFPDTLDD